MVLVKWKETKTVILISNASGTESEHNIKRWCKKEKRQIDIKCTDTVKAYNENMEGVNICDQQLEYNRTWLKTKNLL